MKKNIKNLVVLITGASSGIGREIALTFGKGEAKIAVAARRREKLEEIAGKVREILVLPTDLSDETRAVRMIDKTVEYYGRIDVLINNAAAIIVTPVNEDNSEPMLRSFKTNVLGPMAATNRALKYMKEQGGGQIINIGSPGFMMGVPYYVPYAASKAAMSGWTRTLQAELNVPGIVVSEYFPGYIKVDSPPESKFGPVSQDLLMEKNANALTRYFTRPGTPEGVARDIIRLVEKPRPLMYSGFTIKLGAFLANIPSIRLSIAGKLADTARKRLKEYSGKS